MKTDYYAFIYTPGPKWLIDEPLSKQSLSGHFHYMGRLEADGRLVLGGGFTDGGGAMGALLVSSIEEAREIIENDPAVKEGVVVAQVHPWHVTVARPISKSG